MGKINWNHREKYFGEDVCVTEFGVKLWKYLGFFLSAVFGKFCNSRSAFLSTHMTQLTTKSILQELTGQCLLAHHNFQRMQYHDSGSQTSQWWRFQFQDLLERSGPFHYWIWPYIWQTGRRKQRWSGYIHSGKDTFFPSSLFKKSS